MRNTKALRMRRLVLREFKVSRAGQGALLRTLRSFRRLRSFG
jgi:hypothetical protein